MARESAFVPAQFGPVPAGASVKIEDFRTAVGEAQWTPELGPDPVNYFQRTPIRLEVL